MYNFKKTCRSLSETAYSHPKFFHYGEKFLKFVTRKTNHQVRSYCHLKFLISNATRTRAIRDKSAKNADALPTQLS
jgi:hypothetical protein